MKHTQIEMLLLLSKEEYLFVSYFFAFLISSNSVIHWYFFRGIWKKAWPSFVTSYCRCNQVFVWRGISLQCSLGVHLITCTMVKTRRYVLKRSFIRIIIWEVVGTIFYIACWNMVQIGNYRMGTRDMIFVFCRFSCTMVSVSLFSNMMFVLWLNLRTWPSSSKICLITSINKARSYLNKCPQFNSFGN